MFESLRLLVLSLLYYLGFAYAAFTALKQRSTTVVMAEPSALSPATANAPRPGTTVEIGIRALKLMIMLTTMALLSLVGADWFPLFAEMRVIFMYTLLYVPPFAQQELYDQLFAPLLVRGCALAFSPQTREVVARTVSLFVVRRCIDVAIAAMDCTECRRVLGADAARDISSSLQFCQRALQQAADRTRESGSAASAQIARDRNVAVGFFTSQVRRALMARKERGGFSARIPLGRVVRDEHVDPESSLSVATAAL
ncbi:hypothetical protein LMJF_35_4140 [Leishmania major strain Friedlin]|uniref:Uncharacterized protein n=1 Tax=Leishmania major TaxID=5664 RepID=E9AFP1_LEIMA|nr:hypothetical protein LMJF_35_4140 [Leishmania major strain Friedlin]CAG9582772.1 hypothetical_protein_-_conserved [Leishmania major strain Friedlin]CBZ13045.1 hypothetical protein LMJF_35_4140 [Leishmania major strain Friedlin]|eukprot:XP_003722811.1 hypothetical protein LMJF_35_4140 [Leishmania major strain Friedlin]